MAKYYTVCETTPGYSGYRRNSMRWNRVYKPHDGYLFCDTENTLHIEDIQKPLWQLAKLYDGTAKKVICVRIKPSIIMATFNTAAFPRPARLQRMYRDDDQPEYLSTAKLTGWVFEDVTDPAKSAQYIDYNSIFDDCIMLERLTGTCPCPRLEEGTCFSNTVHKHVPWLADGDSAYQLPALTVFKTKAYTELCGFEYISGQYAIKDDFADSIRPWDNYDFGLVPMRKAEFKERGAANASRKLLRKVECSKCVFSITYNTGVVKDCGRISYCNSSATESEVWSALYGWLENTPFKNKLGLFSPEEIDYLITVSGEERASRAISPVRNTDTHLAGFYYPYTTFSPYGDTTLRYRVSAARGDVSRFKYYRTYADLRKYYPALPPSENLPKPTLTDKELLAHAVFSTWQRVRAEYGHQPHDVHRIARSSFGSDIYGCSSRSTFHVRSLSVGSSAEDFYRALWPYEMEQVKDKLRQIESLRSPLKVQNLDIQQQPPQEPHPV